MRIDNDIVTSRQNRDVVEAVKLLDRKGRERSRLFRIDGIKLAAEAAEKGVELQRVFLSRSFRERAETELGELLGDVRCTVVEDGVFEKMSDEKSPEGIICIAKYLDKSEKSGKIIRREFFSENFSFNNARKRIMAAESVRDPGNLGTLIRTCKALGVDELWVSSDCADILSPKVIRSSMGAVFALDVRVCDDLTSSLASLKADGYRILATALYGESVPLSSAVLERTDVFVIGNEGHGLSREMLDTADVCVYIDMYSGPGCESLNASVAAAICAWEQKRQIG